METALYLFCLSRPGSLPEPDLEGLENGAPVFTSEVAEIAAVVGKVSLNDYCGDCAEKNLQDLSWVGPRALRHAEIIESVRSRSPVLPSRFGTLFSSMESLRELIVRNADKIDNFLDAVSGKDEWSVKVMSCKASLAEKLFCERLADQSKELQEMAPGLRYFKERQLRSAAEKEVGAWMKNVLAASASEFAGFSVDWRQREVSGAQRDGEKIGVANWAFLVHREAGDDFTSCTSRANVTHNKSGLFFEVSGPWPPYSFTPALKTEDEE